MGCPVTNGVKKCTVRVYGAIIDDNIVNGPRKVRSDNTQYTNDGIRVLGTVGHSTQVHIGYVPITVTDDDNHIARVMWRRPGPSASSRDAALAGKWGHPSWGCGADCPDEVPVIFWDDTLIWHGARIGTDLTDPQKRITVSRQQFQTILDRTVRRRDNNDYWMWIDMVGWCTAPGASDSDTLKMIPANDIPDPLVRIQWMNNEGYGRNRPVTCGHLRARMSR